MPLLLYWFDQSLSAEKPHITLEEHDTFVSDDDVAEYNIPKSIVMKLVGKQKLTDEEDRVMEPFRLFEEAQKSGTPPFVAVLDHQLFDVVPATHTYSKKKMPNQGDRVAIWWEEYEAFFDGTVEEVRGGFHRILYDDSEMHWTPMEECKFKILPKTKATTSSNEKTSSGTAKATTPSKGNAPSSHGNAAETAGCLACELPSYKRGHDKTCPRSRYYTGNEQNTATKGFTKKRSNSVAEKKSSQQTSNKRTKSEWTKEEDEVIMEEVKNSTEFPFRSWAKVAEKLEGRDGGMVSNRWKNYLDPVLDHSDLTREDNLALWEGRKKLGNQWTKISAQFFGSTRSCARLYNTWNTASFKAFISSEFGPAAYDAVDSVKAASDSASTLKTSTSRIQTQGNLQMKPSSTEEVADEKPSGSEEKSGGAKNKEFPVASHHKGNDGGNELSSIIDEWENAVSRSDARAAYEKLFQLCKLADPDNADFLEIADVSKLKELLSATRHLFEDKSCYCVEIEILEGLLNQDLEDDYEEEADI